MVDIDERLLQTTVLLKRQFLLTDHLYTKRSPLTALEKAVGSGDQNVDHVLDVMNYTFALIDHIVRFNKIAFSIPKLSHKSPEFRSLKNDTDAFKTVRNIHQHINNDIMKIGEGPLLGSVVWASGQWSYIAALHDVGRQRSSPGMIFDTQENKYTMEFCYVYGEVYYDLGKAIQSIRRLHSHVDAQIKIQVDGKDFDAKDQFACLGIKFDLQPRNP